MIVVSIYFIADTHFGHKNIIEYENRPFGNVEEMDKVLTKNWNNTVSEADTVFMLGDFSFYGKEKTMNICKSLNGKKILVMGNHDEHTPNWYRECGFEEVSRFPVIYENFWILSHEPMYVNTNMPYANIFGHIHSNPIYKTVSNQSACVSVERIDYRPVEFSEIKKLIAEC